ncbi:hypothetical protein VM98_38680, partial [Streptomyces rubellomurinus subsp. indigoferus]
GSAAALDLGLHVVRRDHGAEVANSVSRRLVFAAHRDGAQRQFVERPVRSGVGRKRRGTWAVERTHRPPLRLDRRRFGQRVQRGAKGRTPAAANDVQRGVL